MRNSISLKFLILSLILSCSILSSGQEPDSESINPESSVATEAAAPIPPAADKAPEKKKSGDEIINDAMAPVTDWAFKFIFAGVDMKDAEDEQLTYRNGDNVNLPLIVIWLAGAGLLFTLIFKFVNVRLLPLAFRTVKGKYSKKDDPGEITHFQALTAALSGTVGLGNIAGVAIAISMGGAGAVFWMVVIGVLGMTTKFCECTLGVKYRKIDATGKVSGGPMYYLRDGLKERNMAGLGKTLAILFAIMCVGASFGGGNMFQVNQACDQFIEVTQSDENRDAKKVLAVINKEEAEIVAYSKKLKSTQKQLKTTKTTLDNKPAGTDVSQINQQIETLEASLVAYQIQFDENSPKLSAIAVQKKAAQENVKNTENVVSQKRWIFGLVIALFTAIVILGGIRSIAKVTEKLVPIMCGIYIIAAFIVLFSNFNQIGAAFYTIIHDAFVPEAAVGGFIGAFIMGVRRAAFSNEAGFGSAPIAHSAAKTRHPASEGLVALLEPFVDTVIVCTMTGLVIVITGMHNADPGLSGITLTSNAFETALSWFPVVLSVCVILFAFSTMISWSYYGQQAWAYIFGKSKMAEIIYKLIFCLFIVAGASLSLGSVLDFSDAMLFAMSLFNLIGLWILFPAIKIELKDFEEHARKIDAGS